VDAAGLRGRRTRFRDDESRLRAVGGELPVHVPGGLLVGEPVAAPGADSLQAQRLGRQQDRVVQ
jgi:hypothetical protein